MLGGTGGAAAQPFIRRKEIGGMGQRAAQCRSVLVLPEDPARQSGHVKKTAGISCLISQELERVSVKLRAARFGHDIDHRATGLREFRRGERGLNPKL